jgi:oligoendopeptidase F
MTAATATPAPTDSLPRWNMTDLFAAPDAPGYAAAFDRFLNQLTELESALPMLLAANDQATSLSELLERFNAIFEARRTMGAYLGCLTAADSRDSVAQAKQSELQEVGVRLGALYNRFERWVGGLTLAPLLAQSEVIQGHQYMLEQMQTSASHRMGAEAEDLAISLSPMGPQAWAKLHGDVTSRLMVTVDLPGGPQTLPMSAVRGLARHADPAVRHAAYQAEIAAWPTVAVPLAAAMNAIKGSTNVLSGRRGWPSTVALSTFGEHIDPETLAAMQQACVASFPDFRRYFRAKAKLLGRQGANGGLHWADMFAPVGQFSQQNTQQWSWSEGTAFVVEQFASYSPKMAEFAAKAFKDGWVDAGPREGKRDGAFCSGVRPGESRIMMNYSPSLDSVSTLAHELGHGYHNLNLQQRPILQRGTPSTLAETASIFCETIIMNAALERAEGFERLAILETELQGQAQVVVDIHSRFLFEAAVLEKRQQRELSIEELCELMLAGQRQSYGDGLDESTLHSYMWAMKPHYYGSLFYNYPYTFGLLFALGLYAQYQKAPDSFRASYDDLLSSTGLADAASLCQRFGIDIRQEAFWSASLDIIRARIDEFERLSVELG